MGEAGDRKCRYDDATYVTLASYGEYENFLLLIPDSVYSTN